MLFTSVHSEMLFTDIQFWQKFWGKSTVMRVLNAQTKNSLKEEAVLVTGCSGAQCSVTPARGWVCGVQSDFLSPFSYSGGVKILKVGQGAPIILSASILGQHQSLKRNKYLKYLICVCQQPCVFLCFFFNEEVVWNVWFHTRSSWCSSW